VYTTAALERFLEIVEAAPDEKEAILAKATKLAPDGIFAGSQLQELVADFPHIARRATQSMMYEVAARFPEVVEPLIHFSADRGMKFHGPG